MLCSTADVDVLVRVLGVKLLPNFARLAESWVVGGSGGELALEGVPLCSGLTDELCVADEVGSVTGPLAGKLDEPSLLRPVKSCLLDFLVVDTYGLRVDVVVDEGAGVVVELDVDAPNRVALNLVWNLLLRLPNFLLVDALPLSEDSVVGELSLSAELGAGVVVVDVVVVVVVVVVVEVGVGDVAGWLLLLIDMDTELEVVEKLVETLDGGLTDVVTCTC